MYDLIGDIHGYASELKALLAKMDYQVTDGIWRHPEQSQRRRTDKNLKQHQAFLEQVGESSELHSSMIEWFKTLPLFLDLPELGVVHACWHPKYLGMVYEFTDDQNRLLPHAWEASSRKGSEAYDSIEVLLKGLEIPLPKGHYLLDKEKNKRTDVRAKWWQTEQLTYRDLAIVTGSEIEKIPHDPVESDILPGYDGEKPVFVGHYWRTGEPAPLSEYIACLDYSVAGAGGGKLCAYRFDGAQTLNPQRFIWFDA